MFQNRLTTAGGVLQTGTHPRNSGESLPPKRIQGKGPSPKKSTHSNDQRRGGPAPAEDSSPLAGQEPSTARHHMCPVPRFRKEYFEKWTSGGMLRVYILATQTWVLCQPQTHTLSLLFPTCQPAGNLLCSRLPWHPIPGQKPQGVRLSSLINVNPWVIPYPHFHWGPAPWDMVLQTFRTQCDKTASKRRRKRDKDRKKWQSLKTVRNALQKSQTQGNTPSGVGRHMWVHLYLVPFFLSLSGRPHLPQGPSGLQVLQGDFLP